jgi:hypothetical protein
MRTRSSWVLALLFAAAAPAVASFHLMQVEQLIGAAGGDNTRQAIQLRMRFADQGSVGASRLYVRDANGANPVLLLDNPSVVDMPDETQGARVLITSANFSAAYGPTPDFTLTALIPPSYFAAGSLTFEDDIGTVYWRLSWGGAAYLGSGAGAVDNDADMNFNPPFPLALPSNNTALQFEGTAAAASSNNLDDYSFSSGNAVFTNNLGQTGTVPVALQRFAVD